jgi:hypothetical protein
MARSGFTPVYEDPARFRVSLQEIDDRLGALLLSDALRGLTVKRFGPMFFPAALAGALALVMLGMAVGSRRPRTAAEPDAAVPATPPGAARRFMEVLLFVVLYIALAETAGFILTAAVLLFVHLLRLGTRPAVAVALALTLVPAAYHVFAVVLRVPLPAGMLGW